ncbi:M61 family metallopeptidase [Halobacteriovorax sp.]|uniref:M61 family metallopeptidase n=1 Tax=Halobacteriovorax sp. TaxID=2020862 RepID=UPI0035626EB7
MKLKYKLKIESPKTHYLTVTIHGKRNPSDSKLSFFIPSWSPGSYLMREYGKHIQNFKALNTGGEFFYYEQIDKGVYEVDFTKGDIKGDKESFEISYDVFCHELTVRTSHIDESHAFLHGPTIFMGVLEKEILDPEVEIEFSPTWSKLTTGLKDISDKREVFLYTAKDYDDLIDSPIEIGCQDTDGFRVDGIDHELCWFGSPMKNDFDFKADIKKIVEHISKTMGEIPYEKYTFITHFAPNLFGGLEHKNSTALQYCSRSIIDRKGYTDWLELVAHEYFHTWNVKRIRPKELGPFDYLTEAKTRMHWLTEGLTSFMDQLFVYRCGLTSLEEYLEKMTTNLNRYFSIPGRKFHSLEDSSFNSWIKLYRPDENSNNSSISYYLKGGLVFFVLNVLLVKEGKGINDLLDLLWKRYKSNPDVGMEDHEVYSMIESLTNKSVSDKFSSMITSTEEIDFEAFLKEMSIEVEYTESKASSLGLTTSNSGDRVIIKSVELDGPAHKYGLNAGDEIIAIDGMRILSSDFQKYDKFLTVNKTYDFCVSRLGYITHVKVLMDHGPRTIKSLKSTDENLTKKFLL